MNRFINRLGSSERGEAYNVLRWPFLICTLSYGMGFTFFRYTDPVQLSSLYISFEVIGSFIPLVWGLLALSVVVVGFTFLLFNRPPAGKLSGLLGFSLWAFAGFSYINSGGWLTLFSVALPNIIFWIWQYLSLSNFRREDKEDEETMRQYNAGGYDDENNPKESKIDRDDNRGKDLQSHGSYDNPDDGTDTSRALDSNQ